MRLKLPIYIFTQIYQGQWVNTLNVRNNGMRIQVQNRTIDVTGKTLAWSHVYIQHPSCGFCDQVAAL